MPGLADVAGAGLADLDSDSFGFVDVAAEEVLGLVVLDEVADRGGARVKAGADAIKLGAVGRGVADEDQRREFGETLEALGKLGLGVFAGGVEGRGTGVAQAGDVPAAHLYVTLVEIVQAVARTHAGDLGGRFVVAGKHVDPVAAGLQNLAATIKAFRPGALVARGDIKIGLNGQEAFERLPVIMDVGKNKELQESSVAQEERWRCRGSLLTSRCGMSTFVDQLVWGHDIRLVRPRFEVRA